MKIFNPDLQLGQEGLNVLNSFVEDLFERISDEASKLVVHAGKMTMQYDDIISGAKLCIKSPELCNYALTMAERVVDYEKKLHEQHEDN